MRIATATVLTMLVAWAPVATAQASTEQDLKAGGAKQLTTEEIRVLHADHTVYHRNVVSGNRVAIWYSADGTRSLRAGGRQVTGEWSAKDDRRCEETIAGPIVCMSLYRRGDEVLVCDPREAPDCRWRIERSVEGDAERLGTKP
jgi:hypothetical protein